jgi:hypothetical protein
MLDSGGDSAGEPGELRAIYEGRLVSRGRALDRWARLDRRVADARLVVFLLAVLTLAFVYWGLASTYWWLAVPIGMFVPLILIHEPIRIRGDRARRAVEFYAKGLARLNGKWSGTGVTGLDHLDLEHPYAADLDLFGVGSMFELLCTARTRAGEAALASWLLAAAAGDAIRERHAAIDELRPRLDLREDLELLGAEIRAGIDPAVLAEWGKSEREFHGHALPLAAVAIAIYGTIALLAWSFFETSLGPLMFAGLVCVAFIRFTSRRVATTIAAVDERLHDLVLLSELFERLEREPFQTPLLRRLVDSMGSGVGAASAQIRRLSRLVQMVDWEKNQLFLPLAFLWLWKFQIAVRIDSWRSQSGKSIADWLAAVGVFEALCALACYSAENPADPFPELVEGAGCLEAEGLGHPLILPGECVRNDVHFDAETPVYLVSGSNMSGKSTLLRTVGINAVLAQAGAPVRATRLRISPLVIGATLRIQDSLQTGKSRFYAEISRVRLLVELSRGPTPLLFLMDELFHGTNSHDRCVGAEAVLKGLIDRGAIGLITTHDLALATIAGNLAPRVVNVHFEDHLENGKMTFDYRMRPGVVEHSNALALMRAIGLDV